MKNALFSSAPNTESKTFDVQYLIPIAPRVNYHFSDRKWERICYLNHFSQRLGGPNIRSNYMYTSSLNGQLNRVSNASASLSSCNIIIAAGEDKLVKATWVKHTNRQGRALLIIWFTHQQVS